MEEKQIKVRDGLVNINYLKSGSGNTTILFLHGWCINANYWKPQLTGFSNEYNVCAIDLPGFGKSEAVRNNWTIEEYAKDVRAFIDQLQLKNVILVAHSMSGAIMVEIALKNPIDIIGLIGIDNFKFIDVEFTPEQMEQMSSFFPLLEQDFKTYAPMYAENMLFHPSTSEEVKNRVKTDFSLMDPRIGYNSFMNLIQYSQQEAVKLESLPLELNLINSDSPPTNKTGLENCCKNGFEVQYVERCGHYLMIERPNLFNEVLKKNLHKISQQVLND